MVLPFSNTYLVSQLRSQNRFCYQTKLAISSLFAGSQCTVACYVNALKINIDAKNNIRLS